MILKYVILLIFIITINSLNCYIWNNNVLLISSNNVTYVRRNYDGWFGFNINNNYYIANSSNLYHLNHSKYISLYNNILNSDYFIESRTIIIPLNNFSYIDLAENIYTQDINRIHSDYIRLYSSFSSFDRRLGLPGKISSYNPFSFLIVITTYVILFFLAYIFSYKEPLKSRSYSLYYCLIGDIIYSIGDFWEYQYTYEWYSINGCYIDAYIIYSFQQLTFIIPVLLYFRYIVMLNVNLRKNIMDDEINKLNRILNILLSRKILFFSPIIYMVVFMICMMIISISNNFNCMNIITYNTYCHLTFSAICAFLFIILTIIDIILNIRRCNIKKFFIDNDPFYFRVEQIFIIVVVILFIMWALPIFNILGKAIITELIFLFIILISGGISLIITIMIVIKDKIIFKPNMGNIEKLFNEKNKLYDLFFDYCEIRWSIENVLFKNDVILYRNSLDKKKLAENIYSKYLKSDSIYSVNTEQQYIREVDMRIKSGQYYMDLFNMIEQDINIILNNMYSEFILSKAYKIYEYEIKSKKEMKNILQH